MSHCAPEATTKQIHLKFMPETVVSNILVAQVYREAVPNTWPGSSKAPVTKCVVCAWNSALSVSGRAKPASRTIRDQVYVVGQVQRCLARQRRASTYWAPGRAVTLTFDFSTPKPNLLSLSIIDKSLEKIH